MRKLLIKLRQSKNGFTVVELMIATAVFSILLLLSLAGFLQIGQLFYKGVNITRTSDVGNQIITSIKNDFAFDNSNEPIQQRSETVNINGQNVTRRWICIGSNRYSYVLYRQVDIEAERAQMTSPAPPNGWDKYGLLRDKISGTGCPNPFTSAPLLSVNTATEMLGDKMRLSRINITNIPPSLYTLNVKIAYGDNEVLNNPNSDNASCIPNPTYSRYCFVIDVRTTVRKGVRP